MIRRDAILLFVKIIQKVTYRVPPRLPTQTAFLIQDYLLLILFSDFKNLTPERPRALLFVGVTVKIFNIKLFLLYKRSNVYKPLSLYKIEKLSIVDNKSRNHLGLTFVKIVNMEIFTGYLANLCADFHSLL